MASWYAIRARATGAEVAIYDEIGAYGVSAKGFLAELGVFPISAREVCEALTPAPAALGKSLTPTPKHTLSNALYRLI